MKIVFLTGAGISISSGIPPFHGKGGLYENLGDNVENIITEKAITQTPEKFWDAVSPLYKKNYKPNLNHSMISTICNRFENHTIITQNIDGLHIKYNSDDNIIELHGDTRMIKCINCSTKRIPLFDKVPEPCTICHGPMRPDVLLFQESLEHKMYSNIMYHCKKTDYLITIGTQSTYGYIIGMIRAAKQRGATVIDINPEVTPLSGMAHKHIQERAEVGLIMLDKLLELNLDNPKIYCRHK